ncbi:leucyl aminopeptidase [Lignipirellula cremea]|uniref:Probable cytosol aminopeptidase n=1 Tax=Lignipirellula cremea TaxID=2528010 RepID=A0A518DTB6_9BACT|nr:leucyl aminopeptidase [Lignipirellula cremea]QDU95080.1 Cytosol aminopeptidase [Lignipirellula cremea]
MNVAPLTDLVTDVKADAIVVARFENEPLDGPIAAADKALGGLISKMIEFQQTSGKYAELRTIFAPAGLSAKRLVLLGLGDRETFHQGRAMAACGAASRNLAAEKLDRVAFYLPNDLSNELAAAALCGALQGMQGQDLYRAEKKINPCGELLWAGDAEAIRIGAILGGSVNLTRRLVDEPPSAMYPETFAQIAETVAKDCGLEIEVWDQEKLTAEKCGSLLAVARGSVKPPRLVIMRYQGGPAGSAPLALVGKGVTFDSGGLSIKPTDGMKTMKCDMAGAATVLGAMQAIAQLKLPVNVVGLMGLVENLLDGDAYKLGDVLTARSGKTIEVLNTDAEGRLVLADVLNVALDEKPAHLIDLATLTGACVVALGTDTAGLMTNDQAWCDQVKTASHTCGEAAWQLPMFPEFGDQIKSEVADIKNVGAGRWGGAMTAAKFLEEFVDGVSWTHIDIAGPSFVEGEKTWTGGGATGAFVRTLVEVAAAQGRAS